MKFGQNDYFYVDPAKQSSFVSAEPSAFGFISNTPNKIEVSGSQLSVAEGKTLSLVGGDISLDGAQLNAVNGNIDIASVASNGEVARSVSEMTPDQFNDLGNISLTNAANIDTSGSNGGRIVIRGGNLTLDSSNIAANTTGDLNTNTAEGIDVALTKDLTVDNDSHISTNVVDGASTNSSGITVAAANATLNHNSSIESLAQMDTYGASGNINLAINSDLHLSNESRISTQTNGDGDAGSISVKSNSLELEAASYISTSAATNLSFFSFDPVNAGDIHINSEKIAITGLIHTRFTDDLNLDHTGISADGGFFGGNSGNIDIETSDLKIENHADIRSMLFDDGHGGDITISAHGGPVTLLNGAGILTAAGDFSSTGNSKAGDITITAGDVLVSGAIANDRVRSAITTSADGAAPGGDVNITANSIRVDNGAFILAMNSSRATSQTGNITLSADQIVITGVNHELEAQYVALGWSEKQAFDDSKSSVSVTNDSGILTNPDYVAGNIVINATDFYLTDNAIIQSDNFGQPLPGNITINAIDKAVFDNSLVTTSSNYGSGVGGDINISSNIAVFNHSIIETTAIEGEGGNIGINAKTILATPDAVFNASSQFSVDGNISFNSTIDIEKSVAALPGTVEDATEKFTQDCSMHANKYSRFRTATTYSNVTAANNLQFSNYALNNHNIDSVAASQFKKPDNYFSANNSYQPDALLSGIVSVQIDCSKI